MIFAPFNSTYLSSDTDDYEALVKLVHESHIGGVIAFGGSEPIPQVMLNNTYGAVILGQPIELASILNRLQAVSTLPLLTSSDFEWGVQMRIAGATKFPRAMAFGATGDPQLAYEAGKVVGAESRAIGVHLDFAPVADVNNNPRNPVINIRSFGEDPARAGEMVSGFTRGLQDAGMLATLKHFPGHGDTDVDSHLGLPVVAHSRERLEAVELAPFRAGIKAGAAGVMVAHIEMPAIDPEKQPATFSPKVIGTLLRPGFDGLIVSDSMKMAAITKMASPGDAAVRAVKAGIDVILDSPDSAAAASAIVAAVKAGGIPRAHIEQSARRILEAKARLGLHRVRTVNLDSVPLTVGGRKHDAVARSISQKSITLIKDVRNHVPLATPKSRPRPLPVDSRLSVRLADRRAEPHRDSRAQGALAQHRGGGDFRSRHSVRARPGAVDGRQLRRDCRRHLRSRLIRQRPSRPRAAGGSAVAGPVAWQRAPQPAVRRDVFRQPLHADVRAGDPVDDADLRFL